MKISKDFLSKKYHITFEDNDSFNIKAKDFRELVTDLTDSLGDAESAQFVAQKSGKTSFWLGANVRDIRKLALRKFSKGSLPSILPAPVLDPDRPSIKAPGTAFSLHPSIGGPATGPAAIAEYTRMVEDGNHFVLSGSDIDQAAYPFYQNGNFYATTVTSQYYQTAAVRLPRVGAAWDAALAWPSTGAGIGLPVLLNTARVKWEQDVWAPGLTVNIFGENLAHGNVEGGAGYVAIQQNGGPVKVYDTTAANAYRAPFKVPATVVPGELSYWYHNGNGGDYGWSAKRTVTVVAAADHVLTHAWAQPGIYLVLHPTDGGINAGLIRDAYQNVWQQGGGTFATAAGTFPLNDTIQPKDGVRWVCSTAATGGVTTMVAKAWAGGGNLGMFGSNYWVLGEVDGVEFSKPDNERLADAEAVLVFNNIDQVRLRRVKARWNAPYDQRQAGPVMEAVPAQPLRLSTSKNVWLDELGNTGSGMHLGSNSQVFLTNYTHRATHNADYMIYSLNMLGWCMIGYDLRDLDPTSTDGVDRGIRCIKSGGQGGRNRYRHLEKGIGTQLGIVRSGTNQAPDDNQFEQDLDELNKTLYTDKVVSATANTVTVPRTLIVQVNSQPVHILQPTEHLVTIVAGRGVGQWRSIVSTTVDTITVDEPWLVQPDATSVLHTGWFSCDSTRYDVHYTGKPDNAQNPQYNHSSFYNGFGGVRGGIIDNCSGYGFRQGISYVATQHDAALVDQTAFNVVRNCSFPNSRWGRRFEAVPGQAGWVFDVPGLFCNLFSNCTYPNSILAPLVYQLPRTNAGPVASIATLVEENQPVDVGLNDYTPSFVDDPLFPPIPPLAGTVTAAQLVKQALVLPTAPGVQLVAGGELGPLEPLPAGAGLDAMTGMLSYPGEDEAILVLVDNVQVTPLARTLAIGSSLGGPAAPVDAYTKAESDAKEQAIKQTIADLIGGAPATLDTLIEIANWVQTDRKGVADLLTRVNTLSGLLAGKANEDGRFDLLTPYDRAVPESALHTLMNWDCLPIPGSQAVQAGHSYLLTGSTAVLLDQGVQPGDLIAFFVSPDATLSRIVFKFIGGLIDGASDKRYLPGTAVVFRYLIKTPTGGGNPVKVLETIQETSPKTAHFRGAFVANAYYVPGDMVAYDNIVWTRLAEGGELVFDPAKWAGGGQSQASSGLPLTTTRTADYTLALTDADKMVPVASASAVVVTVPDHATVPFPDGTTLYVAQDGAGDVTIAGASGVVINAAGGNKVGGQWMDVSLHKRDLNTWVLKGGV